MYRHIVVCVLRLYCCSAKQSGLFYLVFYQKAEWRPHTAADAAVVVTPTHSQTWLRLHIDVVAFVMSLSALLQQNRISSLYSYSPFSKKKLDKIFVAKKRQKEIIASRAKWQLHHIPGRSSQ